MLELVERSDAMDEPPGFLACWIFSSLQLIVEISQLYSLTE